MSRGRQEAGFTLVEMIVVCLILGVVLTGITTVFVGGSHAELNVNNRFQAQQSARLAISAMRADAHGACAANVASISKIVLASPPTSGDLTTCGAVGSSASYPKVVWCALASPTVPSTQYALYRSTATDSSCTTANGKLEADNLVSNNVFSSGTTINVEQFQTFNATVKVSLKSGTAGAPYTLGEALTLRNTAYQTTSSSTSCTTTSGAVCTIGACPFGKICYPPVIK